MLRDILKLGLVLQTKAYAQGRAACLDGAAQSDNPFTRGRSVFTDWDLGWREASAARTANENRAIAANDTGSPFAQGRTAAAQGLAVIANPYHAGHPAHEAWRLGWAAARAS